MTVDPLTEAPTVTSNRTVDEATTVPARASSEAVGSWRSGSGQQLTWGASWH